MKTILSIDCGTQSLRAIIFDETGRILSKAQIAYTPYLSSAPGWTEQDPMLYWNSLVQACRQLERSEPEYFNTVSGVGVTTQRATMINVDKNGAPLRPAILWMDQRRAKMHWGNKGVLSPILKTVGLYEKLKDIQTQGKCNWLMQSEPDIWRDTYKYLQVSGFLNFKLTGLFKDSVASQIGHLPFDYRRQKWARRRHIASRLFPVEKEKLPQLVPPGRFIGEITKEASDETGLKKGIPVIASGSDKGCETLGAGVIAPGSASLSFGTTATIQVATQKYIEPLRYMPAYPASIPGFFNPEIEIFRGFWMISWFKQQFAHKEVQKARTTGVPAEQLLNQCLKRTQPGAMGLIVQPYWGPGLGHPEAKGAMIGFGDVHTRDHIYRAVIEGLGFALFEGLEILEAKTKFSIDQATVSGGASQSDEICRIAADIFNRPMVRGQTHETSALGAAVVTAKGLGWHKDFKTAVEKMVHHSDVFEPDPENASIYRRLYKEVYAKIYPSLEPVYRKIRQITGYPRL